jgi:predicted amidohydrolase YtcJ
LLRQASEPEVAAPRALVGARLPARPGRWDVELRDGRIASVSPAATEAPAGSVDLRGRTLVPGLHDPHLHLLALAAEREALVLPAEVRGEAALARLIAARARELAPGRGLRVRRFDPATMTRGRLPDRSFLDRIDADRPLRLQHRNLRFDLLNTAALRRLGLLGTAPPAGVETDAAGLATGRVFQRGDLLSLPEATPSGPELRRLVASASRDLLAQGVTSIGDAGAHNGAAELALLDRLGEEGVVRQRLWTMASGQALLDEDLDPADFPRVRHAKLEAVEARLDLDRLCAAAAAARRAGLGVAVHATTPAELAAAVAALGHFDATRTGALGIDRVEHACVASEAAVAAVAETGAAVVANPGLVAEAGDSYLAETEARERADLHRLRSWTAAGVPLALATDAPVTALPLLAAADAARSRRTASGAPFGAAERLHEIVALAAITATPAALVGRHDLGRIAAGCLADLVVLAPGPGGLLDGTVETVLLGGEVVHRRRPR